jgi:hypothetical protein
MTTIDVNSTNRWYWIGDCRTCPLYRYFDGNYSDYTHYAFWEHDGGIRIPYTPTLCFPYLCRLPYLSVTIGAGDDHFGSVAVDQRGVPYSDYHFRSNLAIRFKVDKDP